MIEAKNLKKKYGEVEALSGVSFTIKDREIIGLLGPNGAGKTTVMRILTGYLQPTDGTAIIDGQDILTHNREIQALIGYLPENAPLYPELTVQSYLQMMADLREIPISDQRHRIGEAVRATGLADRPTALIGTLSKGYRQRVGLAQAILHRPKILILDEPTSGLDPTQIVEVRRLIKRLAQESTVLISTHILSEVEATCDRAIIIMQGQVKADARLSELSATADAVVSVEKNGHAGIFKLLAGIFGVSKVEVVREAGDTVTYRVCGRTDQDLCPAIFALAKQDDWRLTELKKEVRTLEAVFNQLAISEGGVRV